MFTEGLSGSASNARKAEAAFWRSVVWVPVGATYAADRLVSIRPTDATASIGMETTFIDGAGWE